MSAFFTQISGDGGSAISSRSEGKVTRGGGGLGRHQSIGTPGGTAGSVNRKGELHCSAEITTTGGAPAP